MDEKILKKYGFTIIDVAYLTEDQKALLEMEINKKKPNKRVLSLFKRFASVSKRVEGYTAYLKGYDMDTRAMQWIRDMYSSTPPSSREYKVIERVMMNYTKVQIWLGNFFSIINSFNHSMNLRHLSSAEKIMKKLEREVDKGRRVFKNFNSSLKDLKSSVMGERGEEPTLIYFT
jgi:argonaute-like protein implicated in RNA metabolism and viral defense